MADFSSYDCSSCKRRHTPETRDERKGCSKNTNTPFSEWRKEIKYLRCPVNFYSGGVATLIDSFRHFERGILPYNGGLLDMPNKLIEFYNLVESLKLDYQKDLIDRQRKAQERMKNG